MTEGVSKTKRQAARFLKNMRGLINTKDRWCKGAEALDSVGQEVSCMSDDACKRCLSGAYSKASWEEQNPLWMIEEMTRLVERYLVDSIPKKFHFFTENELGNRVMVPSSTFIRFNDSRYTTHKKVLKAIDKAIQMLEKEAGK